MNNRNHQPDILLTGLLLLFIALKLTGTIDWSWWWVLSPIWIPLVVVLVIVAPVLIFTRR